MYAIEQCHLQILNPHAEGLLRGAICEFDLASAGAALHGPGVLHAYINDID